MDGRQFDRLAITLASERSRRALLGLLLPAPLIALLGHLEADAAKRKDRRQRRKDRHDKREDRRGDVEAAGRDGRRQRRKDRHDKHQDRRERNRRKDKKRGQHQKEKQQDRRQKQKNQQSSPPPSCVPDPATVTCAGKCAQVANNCGTVVDCGPCACDPLCPMCQTCNAGTGVCEPVANDTDCDDGDACTQSDTCQDGACVGSNPVNCTPLDQCHDAGTCDPNTGTCSNPEKANGTGCNDGDACTQTDACQNGVCVGANPVNCPPAPNACQDPGTCNPATGICSGPTNKLNGTGCNDGDACTQTDTCQSGACVGANPVVCPEPDQCHDAGTCNPANGTCSNPNKTNGTVCNDGDACTTNDVCTDGVCGGTAVVCNSPGTCQTSPGTCTPGTGVCAYPTAANGTGCGTNEVCCNGTCCAGCCQANGSCGACTVFATSTVYSPTEIDSADVADTLCRTRAAAADLPGANGYRAWISGNTGSPSTRFRCTADACSGQGYKRVDGVTVANDWSDLIDGSLDAAISVSELNGSPGSATTWTGTATSGTSTGSRCNAGNDWQNHAALQGTIGNTGATDATWTDSGTTACEADFSIYCFQQS